MGGPQIEMRVSVCPDRSTNRLKLRMSVWGACFVELEAKMYYAQVVAIELAAARRPALGVRSHP
jgi:hypothetical protein